MRAPWFKDFHINLQVLAHFYRGELARANVWRQRMDATTHWAVVSTMAIISLAYSTPEASMLLLPFCCVLLYLLLHIEARRYRYFDVWRMRVRMLEVHLMVPALLQGQDLAEGNWRETLCNDLLAPHYKMSRIEALGRRLQRTYIWLFLIVLGTLVAAGLQSRTRRENGHRFLFVRLWSGICLRCSGARIRGRLLPLPFFDSGDRRTATGYGNPSQGAFATALADLIGHFLREPALKLSRSFLASGRSQFPQVSGPVVPLRSCVLPEAEC